MIFKRKALSRRTLLKGAGAAISLPLLDSMIPALTASEKTVAAPSKLRRIGYYYIPMGYYPPKWTPNTEKLDELPYSLKPLDPVKDRIAVISNTDLQNAYPGSHATSNSAFLSAARAKRTESSDYRNGTTVDQIAASKIGQTTQLPSLELSMDIYSNVGQCDNGYACVYQNNLSWSSPTQPLPSEAHPRLVFEMMFGEGGNPDQRKRAIKRRANLLDSVAAEIRNLKKQVGAADRNRIDEYLESIQEVERRIQVAEKSVKDNPLTDLDRPVGVPARYGDHAALMFDLQLLAFRADVTRVITFQLAREASTRTYPEIGVPDPHHPVTHHGKNPEKLAKVSKINRYHVSLFADFLKKLNETKEANGTLLDHSLLMYGSGMGDPDAHDHSNLPVLVAGGAAGKMKGGYHLKFKKPTPLANLHLTLLNKIGVPLETFADSTGTVDELFDPVSL